MKHDFKFVLGLLVLVLLVLLVQQPVFAGETVKNELKFSHQLHVVENELDCTTCHEAAQTSTTGKDNLLPGMETCGDCHDIESENNCQKCHRDTENPRPVVRIERYSPIFSHQKHLAAGVGCTSCHAGIEKLTGTQQYFLPTQIQCMDCHSKRQVSNQCQTCHLPGERLKPLNHTANFYHTHGDLARSVQKTEQPQKPCQACHQDNFCQKCHEGDNLDRQTHPLNYQFTHALDAMGKERECAACHTERSFCIDCHQDNLVMPHNHTAGWANQIPGDGGRHRLEAQRDLESCMACHEQNAEQVCQTCHTK